MRAEYDRDIANIFVLDRISVASMRGGPAAFCGPPNGLPSIIDP
jgi:hypothetical protein